MHTHTQALAHSPTFSLFSSSTHKHAARSSNLDACISSGSIFGVYNPGECVIEDSDDAEAIVDKCITNVKKVCVKGGVSVGERERERERGE